MTPTAMTEEITVTLTGLQAWFIDCAINLKEAVLPLESEVLTAPEFKKDYGVSKRVVLMEIEKLTDKIEKARLATPKPDTQEGDGKRRTKEMIKAFEPVIKKWQEEQNTPTQVGLQKDETFDGEKFMQDLTDMDTNELKGQKAAVLPVDPYVNAQVGLETRKQIDEWCYQKLGNTDLAMEVADKLWQANQSRAQVGLNLDEIAKVKYPIPFNMHKEDERRQYLRRDAFKAGWQANQPEGEFDEVYMTLNMVLRSFERSEKDKSQQRVYDGAKRIIQKHFNPSSVLRESEPVQPKEQD